MLGVKSESKLTKESVLFSGDSELGNLMSTTDWSKTPLGSFGDWPEGLKSALRLALNCQYPIAIYWGREGYLFYNDAWRPIVGNKHPWALGRPGREVWSEIWHLVGPVFENVFRSGKGSFQPDSLLPMERHGYKEECYFDYTFSPIIAAQGCVQGIFNVVTETTYRVLNERRTRFLREIAARATSGRSLEQTCRFALEAIGSNSADVPFALLYLTEKGGKQARFQGAIGLTKDAKITPETIDLTSAPSLFQWPLSQACREHKAVQVKDLFSRFGSLPGGAWPEATHTAVILPLKKSGEAQPSGFLIVGVSPRRALDSAYHAFYEFLASAIETAISHAQAYEEERRRAEALAEINRAKTVFFSNASHEFRTPLTLMLGPLEEVLAEKEPALPPAQRERCALVYRNALRLLKLVNALLDFSRLEAGRAQASYQPLPLAVLTTELVGMFRTAIEKAGLTLSVEMEALEEPVYADKDMWEKIVFNLLSNALKYTPTGSIRITLKKAGGAVEFSVADTGMGIPAGELPRIFERFYRVEDVHGRSFEGTGIGLSLTEELVKLHGGTIRVASEVDAGSVFTVRVPLGKAHLPAAQVKETASPGKPSRVLGAAFVEEALHWASEEKVVALPGASGAESKTEQLEVKGGIGAAKQAMGVFSLPTAGMPRAKPLILLADDNADMRNYMSRLLAPEYDVLAVADGEAGVAAARAHKPQLILSDVMMPRLDGFGVIRALRRDPTTQALPIILLSARAGEEAKVEGLEQGADDYLIKPFAAKELLARVKTHLELGRLRMHLQEAVVEATRKLQLLTSLSPVGIYRTDKNGRLLYLNDKGCAILGLSFEEAQGFGWRQALHPDDKEKVLTDRQKNREAKANYFRAEYRYLHRSGTVIDVVGELVAEKDQQGDIIGYIGTLTDITEQKALERAHVEAVRYSEEQQRRRAEDAEKHRRLLEQFIDTMCHELRNPLNGIYGNINLLKTSAAELEAAVRATPTELTVDWREKILRRIQHDQEALAAIDKCARYQKVISDDVLNLSQLEAGKVELSPLDFKPNKLVKDIVDMLETQIQHKHIRVHLHLLPDKTWIKADPNRLMQVLLNLITNALKFTPEEGEITISLAQVEGASASQLLQITVADNGIGMTEEEQARLFDRFSQASRKTAAEYGGSGLGLAISKSLVTLMGGKISVESVKGRGTKFTFTVQYEPASLLPESKKSSLSSLSRLKPRKGLRILIVEDNVINQKLLKRQLVSVSAVFDVVFFTINDGLKQTIKAIKLINCMMAITYCSSNGLMKGTATVRF